MESKGRLIIIAVVGVIIAFGAISVYKKIVGSNDAPLVEKEGGANNVLVADRELVAGTFIDINRDVHWEKVDPTTITENHMVQRDTNLNSFGGAVVRRNVPAGERLARDTLMKSGEGGFMSAVLEPGHRAVSVSVNATSGNAGFISPGDKVDLIVTRRIKLPTGGGANEDQVISETFVHDIRVLAVDQALDNPENKAILAKTVTLEVTTEQAERIAVATELGKISLALRSMTDVTRSAQATPPIAGQPDAATTPGDAMGQLYPPSAEALEQGGSEISRIRVIRGGQVEHLEMK